MHFGTLWRPSMAGTTTATLRDCSGADSQSVEERAAIAATQSRLAGRHKIDYRAQTGRQNRRAPVTVVLPRLPSELPIPVRADGARSGPRGLGWRRRPVAGCWPVAPPGDRRSRCRVAARAQAARWRPLRRTRSRKDSPRAQAEQCALTDDEISQPASTRSKSVPRRPSAPRPWRRQPLLR